MGQHIPLAAGFELVKDGVEDFAEVGRFGPSTFWKLGLKAGEVPIVGRPDRFYKAFGLDFAAWTRSFAIELRFDNAKAVEQNLI